jgi:hypothetical protein
MRTHNLNLIGGGAIVGAKQLTISFDTTFSFPFCVIIIPLFLVLQLYCFPHLHA